jgi:hypothetical protein
MRKQESMYAISHKKKNTSVEKTVYITQKREMIWYIIY